jgi:heme exporter protein A
VSAELLLSVQALTAERAYRLLFRDISFSVHAGDVLRLAGPNGAGKSTLLKVIAGISSDYHGDIFWRNRPVHESFDVFRQETLFLGHNKGVKLGLTVAENLAWFQAMYPCKPNVSIEDALVRVGLSRYAHTLCSQLSAGQQQRVALARMLMSAAKLWLLDEPFTAIDKQGVADFEQCIAEFVAQGGAVIVTTHHDLQLSVPLRQIVLGEA